MAPVSRSVTPMGTRSGPSPTQTQTQTPEPEVAITRQAVLHLRGAPNLAGRAEVEQDEGGDTRTRRRIQWAEDVVDNEGLGRKKSKVCCIYHAPKGIDESSDESSSDSDDSDSDSGDDGAARPSKRNSNGRGHDHNGHDHSHPHGNEKGKDKARSPNAYEKMPKSKGTVKEKQ